MYRFSSILVAALSCANALAGDVPANAPVDTLGIEPVTQSTTISFESLDKNGDQQISRTEAGADKQLANAFATADTNGDGYVSKAEYLARIEDLGRQP